MSDVAVCLGVTNVLLLLALIAQGAWSARVQRKADKLAAANQGLSHVLNATHAEYNALRARITWRSGGVPPLEPEKPRFDLPPPLDLSLPEGDDGTSWDDGDPLKTSFLEREKMTTTQRMAVTPELIEASRPPESESGARPLPTGAKKTGRT